jgi:hypothetical protein
VGTSTISVLLIAGAMLELVGVGLVAWDVLDARRVRVELSRRHLQLQADPGRLTVSGFPATATVDGPAPEPTLEQRVERVEREAELLRRDLGELEQRETRAHRAMSDTFAGWVGEARAEVHELREELRPLIGRTAAGNLRRRAVGVLLFAAGLTLQTAANLGAL